MNTLSKYGEVQEVRRSTRITEKYEELPEVPRKYEELQRSTRSTEVRLFPLEFIYIEYRKEDRKKEKRQKL